MALKLVAAYIGIVGYFAVTGVRLPPIASAVMLSVVVIVAMLLWIGSREDKRRKVQGRRKGRVANGKRRK